MNDEQKLEERKSIAKIMTRTRSKMNDEQKLEERKSIAKIMKKKRSKMNDEQKLEERKSKTKSMKRTRSETNDEKLKQIKLYDCNRQKKRRNQEKENMNNIDYVVQSFKSAISVGPVYVCTCCKRLLYKQSVQHVPTDRYQCKDKSNACLSGYISSDGNEWVCKTCHKALLKNHMPSQAEQNGLQLEKIPDELKDLNSLENHLLSQRQFFMKVFDLPRGKQKGIKGSVVNVPSNIHTVVNMLPRMPKESGLVPVKLKRKLEYAGHSIYQLVTPTKLENALKYLKTNNDFYSNIEINKNWENEMYEENPNLANVLLADINKSGHEQNDTEIEDDTDIECESKDETEDESEEENDENDLVSKLRGFPFDTCLQPSTDPAMKKDEIFSIAPGEGQTPLSMFKDENCEVLAFPKEFPTGKYGLNHPREGRLLDKPYFKQRIMNVDGRFSRNIDYLFFAQYHTESKQIMNNINIAVRMGKRSKHQNPKAGDLINLENVHKFVDQHEGMVFLQSVRGSYPFFHRTLLDLFARLKAWYIPTYFMSFSAADLRWPDVIQTIAKQYGKEFSIEEILKMDYQQKASIIRWNPVTAARHFQYRVQKFIHIVLKSDAQPIGKVIHYFIRIEFQERGSPHIHVLVWIEDAPKVGEHSQAEISQFIDRYICGTIPTDDEELKTLITTLQTHTHSATCRKTGKACRFQFPKEPSSETLIAEYQDMEPIEDEHLKEILEKVQTELKSDNTCTLDELLDRANLTNSTYKHALRNSKNKTSVILKREPKDCFTNNYNPHLLKAWEANMDIQYVTDAYACAKYILSYISKPEREMGQLLKQASKECAKSDNVRYQMRRLGNVMLSHREVSAQEAVYRILSLPLTMSSRRVLFVNTSLPKDRIRLLKGTKKMKQLPKNSTKIFEENILDRYAARPKDLESMCLSEFAQFYRLENVKSNEDDNPDADDDEEFHEYHEDAVDPEHKKITLENKLGTMVKRKYPCVLRTPKFSCIKEPEKYYHALLMLYLPWRNEENDLLKGLKSFFDSFRENQPAFVENMQRFEMDSKAIDKAFEEIKEQGFAEEIWDKVLTDTQQANMKDQLEGREPSKDHMDPDELQYNMVPEMEADGLGGYTIEVNHEKLNDESYRQLVRSLNDKQRTLFDEILKWCRHYTQSKKTGQVPLPFHIFCTGGAGTGKSHVIRAIMQMTFRELRNESENPDDIVTLLTAPTGVSAHNIDGNTIHSALSISPEFGFQQLGFEKLDKLRTALANLRILIIDEISMVGFDLLHKVHRRLQEIKGIRDPDLYFGGVSILAFGDFYQLPPVKQMPIFCTSKDPLIRCSPVHLWKDLFKIVELDEVMRQKDDLEFASLLNRIRKGKQAVTNEDLKILQSRIINDGDKNYPEDALHVFAYNKDVNEHNSKMVQKLQGNILNVAAIDTCKGNIKINVSAQPSETGGLRDVLTVAIGARIMLVKNIDVCDGLVNGVQGTVVDIETNSKSEPSAILVDFDDKSVGSCKRKKQKDQKYPNAVTIERLEVSFRSKEGSSQITRHQFPLTLAFACTIHKVQGLTLDKLVVSFKGTFRGGQAYVGLSRAKSLSGLYITDFNMAKPQIIANPSIAEEMRRLDTNMRFSSSSLLPCKLSNGWLKVSQINARSLPAHQEDIAKHNQLLTSDIIGVTETWLQKSYKNDQLQLDGYILLHKDRDEQFSKENKNVKLSGGGIALYIRPELQPVVHEIPNLNLDIELLAISIHTVHLGKLYIVQIYKPPSVSIHNLKSSLKTLFQVITPEENTLIIMGDFNINLLDMNTEFEQFMEGYKVTQVIKTPTHISGSLLDHIYLSQKCQRYKTAIISVYYSDHDAVFCALPNPGQDDAEESKNEGQTEQKTESQIPSPKRKVPKTQCPKKNDKRHKTSNKTTRRKKTKCIFEKETMKTNTPLKEKFNDSGSVGDVGILMEQRDVEIFMEEIAEDDNIVVDHLQLIPTEDRQKVATYLGVTVLNDPVNSVMNSANYRHYTNVLNGKTPRCQIDFIQGDGNCFFRAISKQILGSENYHEEIRKLICDFMQNHPETFRSYTTDWPSPTHEKKGHETAKQQSKRKQAKFEAYVAYMRVLKKWGTDLEIRAVATLFQCCLKQFTNQIASRFHSWRWIEWSPLEIDPEDSNEGILSLQGTLYLHHTDRIHYDVIAPK
jgi:hypothetical protein